MYKTRTWRRTGSFLNCVCMNYYTIDNHYKSRVPISIYCLQATTCWLWWQSWKRRYDNMNNNDSDDRDNNVMIKWRTKHTTQDNKVRKGIYVEILTTIRIFSIPRKEFNLKYFGCITVKILQFKHCAERWNTVWFRKTNLCTQEEKFNELSEMYVFCNPFMDFWRDKHIWSGTIS